MNTITTERFEIPTIFVIFGITGDLVKKKILKALYDLYAKDLLPKKFLVYGFSRRDYTHEQLRTYLKQILIQKTLHESSEKTYDDFLSRFQYIKGDFLHIKAYEELAVLLGKVDKKWTICSNKLFYLAVPPNVYSQLIHNLYLSGLTDPCSPQEGWTRIILEKPFGTDLESATKLDVQLGTLFKEEQIYRVDHYLAKETVRNILAFRFGNNFLRPAWNKEYIHSISVRLFEKETIQTRGNFYDHVGALRDVGQNHMLEMLALFLMDQPKTFEPDEIRKERLKALRSLQILTKNQISDRAVRGQYKGYINEKGVLPDSKTETYFRIQAFSTHKEFAGVPLTLESGKGMHDDTIEVVVEFKHPSTRLFHIPDHQNNTLHYYLKPKERISIDFLAKKPGFAYELDEHEFTFDYRSKHSHEEFIDDYQALLFDIIGGDQTLFVSTDEIICQWKFIQPIVKEWEKQDDKGLLMYDPGAFKGVRN